MQHLRIRRLLGTSENAVKTLIGSAVCTYVLFAIGKRVQNAPPCLTNRYRYFRIIIRENADFMGLSSRCSCNRAPEKSPAKELIGLWVTTDQWTKKLEITKHIFCCHISIWLRVELLCSAQSLPPKFGIDGFSLSHGLADD